VKECDAQKWPKRIAYGKSTGC